MERGSNGIGSVSSESLFSRVPANPKTSANKVDDTIPWILLYASSLFMLFKQYVNVVQLLEASKLLVQGDIAMRKKARRAESKRNT